MMNRVEQQFEQTTSWTRPISAKVKVWPSSQMLYNFSPSSLAVIVTNWFLSNIFIHLTWIHLKTGCASWVSNHIVAIKRIQYSIIFIVASIVLVTECKKCLDKFLARETGTADTYQETLGVGIT